MNKVPREYLDWLDRHQTFAPEYIGTMLFVNAAAFMIDGVSKGVLYNYDLLFWVQGAQRSNSYGEAEETYETMRRFENIVSEDIK